MSEYFLDRPEGKRLAATDEQITIIEAVLQTKDNILINALAGAAKTTTLEFICKYKTGIPILSLAFNKRIAEEMMPHPRHQENPHLRQGIYRRPWQGRQVRGLRYVRAAHARG
jgi:hypothetical protein